MRVSVLMLLAAVLAASVSAGEYVVFANGARMRVDRHEILGSKVRVYNADGNFEADLSRIQGFEPADDPPQAVPPPAPITLPTPAEILPATPTPQDLADAAADKYGLPRKLVRLVMEAESGFQPQAVSPKGAIGLMQLMPATAEVLGVDPFDPAQNVDGGARYLRDLLQKYDGLLWHALAAYNAGPGAVDKYNGIPPYDETILYVKKINQQYCKSQN